MNFFLIKEDRKRLLSNFFSLSALQGINMVLPLITLPYLVRVLGIENFGLINFSLSIIMYFNILVSFGFELSATRNISISRGNVEKISEIFSTVIYIKAMIALISLFILLILVVFVDMFSENYLLYFATFGIIIGNVLFPTWFFQGIENMKYITYINVASSVMFTILIFIFVKGESDYIYVPMLNSLGTIIGGLYSLYLVFKLYHVKLIFPNKKTILLQVEDSYHFFLSRVANNGSRYFATTIIGIYFGNIAVGYYSMVEKLFYAFLSIGGIVSQTIFPYMSRTKNIVFFKKIFFLIISISFITVFPVMYFNEIILFLVFNVRDEMLSQIFLIVFSGSVFGIASSLLGYPLLAAYGYIKYANNSLIYASIIYLLFIIISAYFFKNIYLVSFSIVVYTFFSLLFRLYYINKTKLFYYKEEK